VMVRYSGLLADSISGLSSHVGPLFDERYQGLV